MFTRCVLSFMTIMVVLLFFTPSTLRGYGYLLVAGALLALAHLVAPDDNIGPPPPDVQPGKP